MEKLEKSPKQNNPIGCIVEPCDKINFTVEHAALQLMLTTHDSAESLGIFSILFF